GPGGGNSGNNMGNSGMSSDGMSSGTNPGGVLNGLTGTMTNETDSSDSSSQNTGSNSANSTDGNSTNSSQGMGGPGGGLLGGNGASTNSEVVAILQQNADKYRWVAATTGSQNAASYQLASQQAVMAIGGFNGTDPAPTLEQFKAYVEAGYIHYYIASGNGMMGGSNSDSVASQIQSWVEQNFTAETVNGVTVYDLTNPKS
ncbi:MAG: glycosyl transferase family 39, partial [Bifidobacteriaceae bacterium]|nr:glycosyl transferase family 39 [Bifidobacteriaceae bacterium]